MSEEKEVNYASVVFKANKNPQPEAPAKRDEETVYDEVKVQNETGEQTADTNTGFFPDKKANNRYLLYQRFACCLGILCVILLSGIIAVCVYLATLSHESDERELNQLKENQRILLALTNLTNLNNKLSSDNENLRRVHNNLTVQFGNLTQNYTVLESQITNLTAENQQLETQRNDLRQQIRDMETNWIELNVTRVQWSIDAYCPEVNINKKCEPCQHGWKHKMSNCYAINNAIPSERRTWEGAREDCRGKSSDLIVLDNAAEKEVISDYSWGSSGTDGYWIGLRAEGGRWKWIDGSNLTVSDWIQQTPPAATDGHCAMSVQDEGWLSVSCDDRKQWICKKKALSV